MFRFVKKWALKSYLHNMKSKNLFVLVFLLIFQVSLFAIEVDFNTTNLWCNSSGKAIDYDLDLSQSFNFKENNFNFGVGYNQLNSTLDFFQNTFHFCNVNFLYANPYFETKTNFNINNSEKLFLSVEKKEFLLNEIKNMYFQQEFLVKINDFQINPFAFFSNTNRSDGEFYWVNGQIEIPFVKNFGINLKYKQNELKFSYSDGNLNLYNTDSDFLGNLFAKNFKFSYQYDIDLENFSIIPQFEYNFILGNFDISLTKDNQKFLLFPFIYSNIDGNFYGHLLNPKIDFRFIKKNFTFICDLETFYFVKQDGSYLFDYKYKKNFIFDGSSGSENSQIDILKYSGLILLNLDCNYTFYIKKFEIDTYFTKDFVIPFSFNVDLDFDDFEITREDIKSWLFSGISLGMKIKY